MAQTGRERPGAPQSLAVVAPRNRQIPRPTEGQLGFVSGTNLVTPDLPLGVMLCGSPESRAVVGTGCGGEDATGPLPAPPHRCVGPGPGVGGAVLPGSMPVVSRERAPCRPDLARGEQEPILVAEPGPRSRMAASGAGLSHGPEEGCLLLCSCHREGGPLGTGARGGWGGQCPRGEPSRSHGAIPFAAAVLNRLAL